MAVVHSPVPTDPCGESHLGLAPPRHRGGPPAERVGRRGADMRIDRVVVVGAGIMGSGIAQSLAVAGASVTCCDIDPAQLERAAALTEGGRYGFARAVDRGKLSPELAAA